MTRTERLAKTFGGKIMAYKDLPIPAQLAIAHYMAIDGEAWTLPEIVTRDWSVRKLRRELPGFLPYFRAQYGKTKFGYVRIPTAALIEEIKRDAAYKEAGEPELFRDEPGFKIPKHPSTSRWPVILSDINDETLQDGWHRLGAYYRQRARVVPAVYYPRCGQ